MALRRVPIRRIGNRHNLFMGSDRKALMMAGIAAAALIFSAQTLYATTYGLLLWFTALFVLRLAAKNDPILLRVAFRHAWRYKGYYPSRATPFRQNTHNQRLRYR
jgi:type IV secretory pathway TrbD component